MRLKDKVAIVTGGAHGMGEAEARLFAAEGAKVIVADILADDAEIVAADIRGGGGEATAATIDVTDEAEWIALIAKAVATYGRLDILVNNAGISGSSVGDPSGLEGWHRIIAVNQTSVFLGTKLAAEQMTKTGGGSIVNISSIMGFVGSTSGHPAYHASKGAVRIYSKAAAVRYGPSGIRVNTVHPGYSAAWQRSWALSEAHLALSRSGPAVDREVNSEKQSRDNVRGAIARQCHPFGLHSPSLYGIGRPV